MKKLRYFSSVVQTGLVCLVSMMFFSQPLFASGGVVNPVGGGLPTSGHGSSSIPKFTGGGTSAGPGRPFENNFDPARLGLNSLFNPSKIGFKDSPGIGAEKLLIEGDYYSADRACLKEAQQQTDGYTITDREIDTYRNPGYAAAREAKQAFIAMPDNLKARFSKQGKNIFERGNHCTLSSKERMCRKLLARALTDESQSHYKPPENNFDLEKKDKEKEIIPDSVLTAKEAVRAQLEKDNEEDEKAETIGDKISGVKPDSTMNLILIIDQALANGQTTTAAGAMELLKEINPSAAHALECLGINPKPIGNEPIKELADGILSKEPKVGPITGFDYTDNTGELAKGGGKGGKGGAGGGLKDEVGKAILVKVIDWTYEYVTGETRDAFMSEEEKLAKLAQEHKDWQDCKKTGSAACDQFYKDAVKAEERASKGLDVMTGEPLKDSGAGGPAKPVESGPQADLSGYTGPVIGPGPGGSPERPVEDLDFGMEEKGPFGGVFGKMDREELAKTRDPQATENYCAKVVADFKGVQKKGLTMTEFRPDSSIDAHILATKMGSGGAPMPFETWNADFWKDVEREELKDPRNVAKKNNCNTMDPVQPE